MKNITKWTCLLLLCFSGLALADDLTDLAKVRSLADSVMRQIQTDDVKAAFANLSAYWGLPSAEVDVAVSKIIDQRKLISSRFGKPVGLQFIDQKSVADTFVRLRYVEKFENHFIKWQLFFYKPQTVWRFDTFNMDDQIGALPYDG